jgi:hypothetical protein
LLDFKTGEIAPCRFTKALGATLRHLFSNWSKGFELAGFEKISANLKTFGAKQLRTYEFSLKLKALWTPAYSPGRRSDQSGVRQQHWTVHVHCLYISCYVTVNKPVLSYLLSRLLLQW